MIDHQHWAEYLLAATDEKREVGAITKAIGELPIDDAYLIQAAGLDLRLKRGERIVGAKLGLTSAAKQEQMGVDEPVYGLITDASVISGSEVPIGELIHPRCEPEIVFHMSEDLGGADVTRQDVLDASLAMTGGIEIIDSRFEAFSFTLPDVVADNTSAARVLIGSDGADPRQVDPASLECTLSIDGTESGKATGQALLGDPVECVAMLARHLHRYGQKLESGWFVLAGAVTDAKPLAVGTEVVASYSAVDSVSALGV